MAITYKGCLVPAWPTPGKSRYRKLESIANPIQGSCFRLGLLGEGFWCRDGLAYSVASHVTPIRCITANHSTFFFGPGLSVPFNSRAFSTWAALHSLTALPFTSLTRGAAIFRVAIQNCKVALGILVILATCTVV